MAGYKTLIVCLSSDLPSEENRDTNCMYFVFNTLELYIGKVLFGENFCIVESMPEDEPNVDQIYICLDDGYVKVYDDYGIHIIAQIQTPEMIDVLRKAGTSYFYNSKERYIDDTARTFVLPFNDGEFNMVVDFYEDTVINESTIIKYNTETGHFEISSDTNENAIRKLGISGSETDSAIITVDNGKIKGDVKISRGNANIMKVAADGLYATVNNKVPRDEYESWRSAFSSYRVTIDATIDTIEKELSDLEDIVSREEVEEIVEEKLEEVIPFIEEAVMRYDSLVNRLYEIAQELRNYTDNEVSNARAEIEYIIDEQLEHPWGDLDYQSLDEEDFARITLSMIKFMQEHPISDFDAARISLAISKFIEDHS